MQYDGRCRLSSARIPVALEARRRWGNESSCGSLPRYAASSFVEQTAPVAFALSDSASQVLEVNFTDPMAGAARAMDFDGMTVASRRDFVGVVHVVQAERLKFPESFSSQSRHSCLFGVSLHRCGCLSYSSAFRNLALIRVVGLLG